MDRIENHDTNYVLDTFVVEDIHHMGMVVAFADTLK